MLDGGNLHVWLVRNVLAFRIAGLCLGHRRPHQSEARSRDAPQVIEF